MPSFVSRFGMSATVLLEHNSIFWMELIFLYVRKGIGLFPCVIVGFPYVILGFPFGNSLITSLFISFSVLSQWRCIRLFLDRSINFFFRYRVWTCLVKSFMFLFAVLAWFLGRVGAVKLPFCRSIVSIALWSYTACLGCSLSCTLSKFWGSLPFFCSFLPG